MIKTDWVITKTDEERYLPKATVFINDIIDRLGLPKIIYDDAILIYRQVLKKRLRGKGSKKMYAVCVYAAIRRSEITTRTLNELARESNYKKIDIQRLYRKILPDIELNPGIPDPEQRISKIINSLNFSPVKSQLILRFAHNLLRKARKSGINFGKSPNGLAAAAVYLSCKEKNVKRTQKEICELADITELILRQRKDELEKIL